MSVIQIREAKREGARLVVGIAGVSGSGKTFTALQLAFGLANGDAGKVGFLDTENRRGSLYADSLPAPFLIGDLFAPFSPQRYVDAILQFQKAGVEVLVIDSVTHEWEGVGGCEEIANNTTSRIANWKLAKAEHKKFMNALLQCNMHIVACIRAREKVDFSDPKNPRPLGVQPIQEKNFMFEMTASVMMHDAGRRQTVLKCPAELVDILGRGSDYITSDDGRKLRAWVDGAAALDAGVEYHRNSLQTVTQSGLAALKSAWEKTPAKIRKSLGNDFLQTLKTSAESYDKTRAGVNSTPDVISELNKSVADHDGF
jgi:hypothetical protein